uniref:RNase H type-1 domain-containing protein n=1 Tax=Chenopodium quinoa TaxID=63459 RepID=A0A803MMD8_CHEQI
MEVLNKAISSVVEYGSANEKKGVKGGSCSSPAHRVPPEGNMYKINCDAVMFSGGAFDVEVAEALGARHALKVAFDAGLRRVVLETDCLMLFTHLSKKIVEPTVFGLKDILAISSLCTTVKLSHVRKQGNTVAHNLAKLSKSFTEMRVWIEESMLRL